MRKTTLKKQSQGGADFVPFPQTDEFRAWVRGSAALLGLPVSRLSVASGMSQNALARFLNCAGVEIQLGSARRVVLALQDAAKKSGVNLSGVEL